MPQTVNGLMLTLTQQRKRRIKSGASSSLLASLAIAISINGSVNQPIYAQQRTYECVQTKNVPTTVAHTTKGTLPIIRWISTDLPAPLTPQKRCEEVSQRFQAYRDNGSLRFITTGNINGKPVVCVAKIRGGDCTDILFEVKSGKDPKRVLKKLLNQSGLGAGNPLNEGGARRVYIDMTDYLNKITTD